MLCGGLFHHVNLNSMGLIKLKSREQLGCPWLPRPYDASSQVNLWSKPASDRWSSAERWPLNPNERDRPAPAKLPSTSSGSAASGPRAGDATPTATPGPAWGRGATEPPDGFTCSGFACWPRKRPNASGTES